MLIQIPGLFYNGKQVSYDDGVVVAQPPVTTQPPSNTTQGGFGSGSGGGFHGTTAPTPTPVVTPPAVAATTYPANQITLPDAMFLFRKDIEYRHIVPNADLFFDILSQGGKTYAQMTGLTQQAFKTTINRIINLAGEDNSAATSAFNVDGYTGPLKQIYINLVNSKRGL